MLSTGLAAICGPERAPPAGSGLSPALMVAGKQKAHGTTGAGGKAMGYLYWPH
ncbi:hypothetical protein SAMN07250955_101367 [Arboricoccus pini]|uniref:Uncharacterized protein n=1 Tax=Arboricoccus pini TaxID=1963835 RepID=A0A212Q2W2_9PROT|nr:hypothetical protein SAMN07250955_101367 [Arboricoccus pini]